MAIAVALLFLSLVLLATNQRWPELMGVAVRALMVLSPPSVVTNYTMSVGSDVPRYEAAVNAGTGLNLANSVESVGAIYRYLAVAFNGSTQAVTLMLSTASIVLAGAAIRKILGGSTYLVRVLMIVCLSPSVILWSTQMGKEPLVMLAVASVMYARETHNRMIPILLFLPAVAVLVFVRPYVALALVGGHYLATILPSRRRRRQKRRGILRSLIGLVAAAVGAVLIAAVLFRGRGVLAVSEAFTSSNDIGGSALGLRPVTSLSDFIIRIPIVVVSFFLRPLAIEATAIFPLLLSLELSLIWVLLWIKRDSPEATQIVSDRLRRRGFISQSVVFAGLIALAIANLGTLARTRSSIWPVFILAIVSVCAGRRDRAFRKGGSSAPTVELNERTKIEATT